MWLSEQHQLVLVADCLRLAEMSINVPYAHGLASPTANEISLLLVPVQTECLSGEAVQCATVSLIYLVAID